MPRRPERGRTREGPPSGLLSGSRGGDRCKVRRLDVRLRAHQRAARALRPPSRDRPPDLGRRRRCRLDIPSRLLAGLVKLLDNVERIPLFRARPRCRGTKK